MWCQKRITNQDLLVRFQDGKHRFYLESVCGNPVEEGKLCNACRTLNVQTKTQDVKTFPHGLVSEEYPACSHIYDSTWYTKKVKAYGPPSQEDLELAMEAQKRARAGLRTRSIKEMLMNSEKPVEKVAEKVAEKAPEKAPEKEKRKPGRKPKEEPERPKLSENAIHAISSSTKYAESMDTPLEISGIVRTTFKLVVHNGSEYWKDNTDRIYKKTKEGRLIQCVQN